MHLKKPLLHDLLLTLKSTCSQTLTQYFSMALIAYHNNTIFWLERTPMVKEEDPSFLLLHTLLSLTSFLLAAVPTMSIVQRCELPVDCYIVGSNPVF